MRHPKRIGRILEQIGIMWREHSDWRLGQLIVNVLTTDSESGLPMRPSENEIFNYEDDKFEKVLDEKRKLWAIKEETKVIK